MKKINCINWRITPQAQRIIISYRNEFDKLIVLTPNYNSVYEFAAKNSHLEWFEDKLLPSGEHITEYRSVTFDELLTSDVADLFFTDYIKRKCKNNCLQTHTINV